MAPAKRLAARVLFAQLLILASAAAQPGPVTRPAPPLRPSPVGRPQEITIYRDRGFNGPAVSIQRDERNLGLAWTVSSVRVRSGTWSLCERPNFQGSCLPVSADNSNLGSRRVQSVRAMGSGGSSGLNSGWRWLGDSAVNRLGWDRVVIHVSGRPSVVSSVRFCAEQARLRLRDARASFTDNRVQMLQVPSQVESGDCTRPLMLSGPRRFSSIEVTAATTRAGVRGRIRLEGR